MNKILTGAIGLAIIIGGWSLLKDNTPPLTSLPTSEASSIKATATLNPDQPMAGESTTINFSFANPNGTPVGDLMPHHARRVHVLIVSEDLNSIGHIHPEDFNELTDEAIQSGTYSVNYTFPKAGKYIVGVDIMNMESELAQQFVVNVKGDGKMNKVASDLRREKCFRGYQETGHDRYINAVLISEAEVECPNGYKVTMIPSITNIAAGEEIRLTYRVEKNGAPVMSLSPYLDAAIHFAIVPESFDAVLHRHGNPAMENEEEHGTGMNEEETKKHAEAIHEEVVMEHETNSHEAESAGHHDTVPESFGPGLVSESIVFSKAGLYQVFTQVKHDGNIIFTSFMVEVEEGFDASTAKVMDLKVENRALMPHIVTLTEGDKVILLVSTDEAGEFHVTGYGIEKEMTIDETTEVRFTANLPGRYNLELHPEGTDDDIEIGALVVNPR